MRLQDHMAHSGDLLFRWRSYLPLLFVPLVVASFLGVAYPRHSHVLGLAWELGCLVLALLGLAVRVYTVGTAPSGTSGRNTKAQRADVLNTDGPYSLVRHPLYVGNALCFVGIAAFPRSWSLIVIVMLAATLYYERIAAREEQFLEEKFGDDFRRWAARTNAVWPRLSRFVPSSRPFRPKKALRQEIYGLSAIVTTFFAMDVLEDLIVHGRLEFDPMWTTLFVVVAGAFLVVRTLKKKTALLAD